MKPSSSRGFTPQNNVSNNFRASRQTQNDIDSDEQFARMLAREDEQITSATSNGTRACSSTVALINSINLEYKKPSTSKGNIDNSSREKACDQNNGNPSKKLDFDWLCLRLEILSCESEMCLTKQDLIEGVMSILTRIQIDNEQIGAELCNFLGIDNFEFIQEILEHKQSIIRTYKLSPSTSTLASSTNDANYQMCTEVMKDKIRRDRRKELNPLTSSNIVIHTEGSKNLMKQARKHQRKYNKLVNQPAGQLSAAERQELIDNAKQSRDDTLAKLAEVQNPRDIFKKEIILSRMGKILDKNSTPESALKHRQSDIKYPHVYDCLSESKLVVASLNNQKVYLPVTSARKSTDQCEEITIEKMPIVTVVPKDKLIKICDSFDPVGKVAFQGFLTLNPMQTLVYEAAYNSNINLLVAAPTGSGKTNVAMMTVLHELKNYFKPGTTDLISSDTSEKFKIIYIAPMKSLATEQTENFSNKLKGIGIKTRELTGDMSLTEYEISQTHIIVTTPEKWDVVTRKSKGEVDLLSLVRLLIIDEVHLLQSDRGPVLEALVARTLRYVESSQKMIRIVGLSATLPNYIDVATFLRVNPYEGLFYFDNRFRPVPLTQTFVGVRALDSHNQSKIMDKLTYDKVLYYVQQSKQVMIFVHARNSTQRTATKLREYIQLNNKNELFQPDLEATPDAARLIANPRNKLLKDLFLFSFGIHHAGMVRSDRLLVERLFREGVLKVLVCTATLAWGVNFPAHAVIIRGTELYDASAGKFVDIGLLDVMQIFGRAGRPQYDSDGHAIIMTALDKMDMYLKLLTNQTPIESNFIKHMTDNLNAEVVAGTIASINEAVEWLRYTYLHVRLALNPLAYGFDHYEILSDPSLVTIRQKLLVSCAQQLDDARMCRYNQQTGSLEPTDLGRIASHFYINYETVSRYNELLKDDLQLYEILGLIGEAQEFAQIKYREEEAHELDVLRRQCRLPIHGQVIETTKGKVSCLLQAYISRAFIESHSLISDLMYISQNAVRIARGLFEYSLKCGWPFTALNLLKMCKMLELQVWEFQSPYRQFSQDLPPTVMEKLEESKFNVDIIDTMSAAELGKLVNFPEKMGNTIKDLTKQLPYIVIEGIVRPIKPTLITLTLDVTPFFKWNDRYHGRRVQSFWIWIVDDELTETIYHSEHIKFSKEQVQKQQKQTLIINIPLVEEILPNQTVQHKIPSEYIVFASSNDWIGCDYEFTVDCSRLKLPEEFVVYTKLLDLDPLPVSALKNELYQSLYDGSSSSNYGETSSSSNESNSCLQFNYFNNIQTQLFYPLYNSSKNLLVCAPSGSGKTILAELAMLNSFKRTQANKKKIIYLTPIQSLATHRFKDWQTRMRPLIGHRIMELNEYSLYNEHEFDGSDIIVATAEKFYVWLTRQQAPDLLKRISLIIIDELHLISDGRGCMMELVVSRLNYLTASTSSIRFRYVGLSMPLANAQDLASFLNIKRIGAYNFHPATSRPIPIDVHIIGFSERHYSPRMATMNKPIFKSIVNYSKDESVIIYVSSKKQCKSTALDLISCLAQESTSQRQWLHMEERAIGSLVARIQDEDLKLSLEFGIGFHYKDMRHSDRRVVEELYLYQKIQILLATTSYAWESPLRAHLVIIKGTEYYDHNAQRYSHYPAADILQQVGRAGRPQLDSSGTAVIMVQDIHKEFYKKFVHEPFPVESNLVLTEDMIIKNFLLDSSGDKQKSMDKLSQTFYARRLLKNPSYYQLYDKSPAAVDKRLSALVDSLYRQHELESAPSKPIADASTVSSDSTKRDKSKVDAESAGPSSST